MKLVARKLQFYLSYFEDIILHKDAHKVITTINFFDYLKAKINIKYLIFPLQVFFFFLDKS